MVKYLLGERQKNTGAFSDASDIPQIIRIYSSLCYLSKIESQN